LDILIAELEERTVLELKNMLPNLGHTILTVVSSGKEAVKKTVELGPDLVLIDINLLGVLKGVDAGKKIMDKLDVPVIFITVFTKNCLTMSLQLPEDAITLSKPIKQDHLKYAISNLFKD
jgi:two-component system, response regulator PdtaR